MINWIALIIAIILSLITVNIVVSAIKFEHETYKDGYPKTGSSWHIDILAGYWIAIIVLGFSALTAWGVAFS